MADSVMIKIPPLTEERRKDTVKIAKKMAEDAKVSVRTVRQDILKELKKAEDDGEISEDDLKTYEKDLQKLVDDTNKHIDEMTKKKETDIMKI
ncbi:Ribosome recycling factor (Ribosome-releasing factor) (RRF) [sediment metagenome]|uniref:Ribosome recycling factor (Ribosome-releasing factor) (RRF) n=1 Tax=sediment metagenome TaxID=749907 RepID=D9PJ23_9ZZZZ